MTFHFYVSAELDNNLEHDNRKMYHRYGRRNIWFGKCKWKTALGKCGCRWQNNTEVNFETLKIETGLNWPQRRYRGVLPRWTLWTLGESTAWLNWVTQLHSKVWWMQSVVSSIYMYIYSVQLPQHKYNGSLMGICLTTLPWELGPDSGEREASHCTHQDEPVCNL